MEEILLETHQEITETRNVDPRRSQESHISETTSGAASLYCGRCITIKICDQSSVSLCSELRDPTVETIKCYDKCINMHNKRRCICNVSGKKMISKSEIKSTISKLPPPGLSFHSTHTNLLIRKHGSQARLICTSTNPPPQHTCIILCNWGMSTQHENRLGASRWMVYNV